MSNLVDSIRPSVAGALAALPWVFGTLLFLSACGGQPEVAKQPEPVKVVWNRSDGTEAPGEAPAEAADAPATGSKEIDLDALALEKTPAPKAKAKEQKAKEQAQTEPPAASAPPPAPEAEAEVAAEPPAPEPPPVAESALAVPLGKEIRAAVKAKDRDPPTKKPAAKKKAPAEPSSAAAEYTGPSPCKAAHFSVPRVKEACSNGGRPAAKAVMKDAVGKALAAGASLKCGDCHAEQTNYTLKKDAVAKLKKWLGP